MNAETMTDWEFRAHLRLFGYALWGDPCEVSAAVAEARNGFTPMGDVWDRTAADLARQFIAHGAEPYRRVRDHAALRWVTEHAIRGHIDWPGL